MPSISSIKAINYRWRDPYCPLPLNRWTRMVHAQVVRVRYTVLGVHFGGKMSRSSVESRSYLVVSSTVRSDLFVLHVWTS
jgi:hypothetical protein